MLEVDERRILYNLLLYKAYKLTYVRGISLVYLFLYLLISHTGQVTSLWLTALPSAGFAGLSQCKDTLTCSRLFSCCMAQLYETAGGDGEF